MPTRIAHFTDLHFTEPPGGFPWRSALSKRLVGWANLRLGGRHRHFLQTREIVEALVRDLLALELDGIVFTGDVSGLSLVREFEVARETLEPLLDDPRVCAIPGNHDIYVRRARREGLFERYFPNWSRSDPLAATVPDSRKRPTPYPVLRLFGDDVACLLLRDARPTGPHDSSGRLDRAQLERLEKLLALEEVRSRTIFLGLHYSLLTARGERDRRHHRLRNDRRLLRLLEGSGVRVVLSGHIHRRIVHLPTDTRPYTLANPGSLTYAGRDQAYHVFTVEGESIDLETRKFDPTSSAFHSWDAGALSSL